MDVIIPIVTQLTKIGNVAQITPMIVCLQHSDKVLVCYNARILSQEIYTKSSQVKLP